MNLTIIDDNNIFHKDVIGNVRTAQEDSHGIATLTPNGDVFVVCDGMGGHVGGKQASSIAVKSIIDYLKKEKYPQPIQALNDALQFANMQILAYANEHPELKGMGTTACIVLMQDSEAYIAHVGDSRIYLYLGKERKLHRITKDHSYVQTLVDAGQITDEEAEHHSNKNRILKALGIKTDLVPSFDRLCPKNGDVFLICSDGLSGMISDSTMSNILTEDLSIAEKGETLISLALKAGGLDNITLELIQITNSPHPKSIFKSYNPISRIKNTPRAATLEPKKRANPKLKNETKRNPSQKKQIAIIFSVIVFLVVIICGSIYIYEKWRISNTQDKLKHEICNTENEITNLNKQIKDDRIKWQENNEKIRHAGELNDNKDQSEVIEMYQKILKSIENDLERNNAKKDELKKKLKQLKDSITKLQP